MSTSETLRGLGFLFFVVLAYMSRNYFRANEELEDRDTFWWSDPQEESKSQPVKQKGSHPASTTGSSRTASGRRGRSHEKTPSQQRENRFSQLQVMEQHFVEKVSASFDDSLPSSTDNAAFSRNPSKALAYISSYDTSGASSPAPWAGRFPAAQLRPY